MTHDLLDPLLDATCKRQPPHPGACPRSRWMPMVDDSCNVANAIQDGALHGTKLRLQ